MSNTDTILEMAANYRAASIAISAGEVEPSTHALPLDSMQGEDVWAAAHYEGVSLGLVYALRLLSCKTSAQELLDESREVAANELFSCGLDERFVMDIACGALEFPV